MFSTILGWLCYGEKAAEYLFGPSVIRPYRWLWVAAAETDRFLWTGDLEASDEGTAPAAPTSR